jgi:hypothetical protein
MPEYLENPRRTPRQPLRCHAWLVLPSGNVETATEDVGARGCQIVLPEAVERGRTVCLVLEAPRGVATLQVNGRVAWVSPRAPWRVGVAYAAGDLAKAAQWLDGVRRVAPELFPARRTPERVALEAMVYLGQVPRLVDFGEEDLALLGRVGTGLRLGELRTGAGREWPARHRRFFALLEQGHLTLSRAAASHPGAWQHILGRFTGPAGPAAGQGRRLAGSEASPFPSPPAPPVDRAAAAPAPVPVAAVTPVPAAVVTPVPAAAVTPLPAAKGGPPAPDFTGAGVGWRAPATSRSPEAEAIFKLALAEIEARRTHQALALLRRALGLAPGDPEIAGAIGLAMRVGRSA